MNSGLPEMLHCLNTNSENTEMSVLQRQRSRQKWQQEQVIEHQPVTYFNENEQLGLGGAFLGLNSDQGLCELLVSGAMKPDPGVENGSWTDDFRRFLNYGNGSEFEMSYALPRTVSCPPNVAANIGKEVDLSSAAGRESSKKRKADKTQNLKVVAEEKSEEKKMKGCAEEESKSTTTTTTASTATNNKNTKTNTKENSKVTEVPKTDYIHVRARRGQATDSHSLEDLVPGCNKITGKAGMLDEIINYVQSLYPTPCRVILNFGTSKGHLYITFIFKPMWKKAKAGPGFIY